MRGVSAFEKIQARVEKTEGCWVWPGSTSGFGYGRVWDGERELYTHRVSWEGTHGPIPEGMCVLHRCDNPPCVNPAHLFLGTDGDNARDMISKGRHRIPVNGEYSPRAKLTAEDAKEICRLRSCGRTQESIARQFGVHQSTISCVLSGRTRLFKQEG